MEKSFLLYDMSSLEFNITLYFDQQIIKLILGLYLQMGWWHKKRKGQKQKTSKRKNQEDLVVQMTKKKNQN